MDIRDVSYQKVSGIESVLRSQCSKIENFRDTAYGGVTIKKEEIRSSELVVYIPSSSKDQPVDRAAFDQAVKTYRNSIQGSGSRQRRSIDPGRKGDVYGSVEIPGPGSGGHSGGHESLGSRSAF